MIGYFLSCEYQPDAHQYAIIATVKKSMAGYHLLRSYNEQVWYNDSLYDFSTAKCCFYINSCTAKSSVRNVQLTVWMYAYGKTCLSKQQQQTPFSSLHKNICHILFTLPCGVFLRKLQRGVCIIFFLFRYHFKYFPALPIFSDSFLNLFGACLAVHKPLSWLLKLVCVYLVLKFLSFSSFLFCVEVVTQELNY